MAISAVPVNLQSAHLTNQQKADRQKAEDDLKGNDDMIYNVPPELKTKKEKELYNFFVNELKSSNVLCNVDKEILILCVNSIVRMVEADKEIKKRGLLIERKDGSVMKNPACNIYKDYETIYLQCVAQLGLSPSSRSKLASINVNTKQDNSDPVKQALGNLKKMW